MDNLMPPVDQDKTVLKHCLEVEYDSLTKLHDTLLAQNAAFGDTVPVNDAHMVNYIMQTVLLGDYRDCSIDETTINQIDLYLWRIGMCVFVMNYLSDMPGSVMSSKEVRSYLKTCEGEIKNGKDKKETP